VENRENEKDGKGLNKVEHASEGQTHVLSAALKLVLCIVLMFWNRCYLAIVLLEFVNGTYGVLKVIVQF